MAEDLAAEAAVMPAPRPRVEELPAGEALGALLVRHPSQGGGGEPRNWEIQEAQPYRWTKSSRP